MKLAIPFLNLETRKSFLCSTFLINFNNQKFKEELKDNN